ncbi:outer membrane beta-barrel family protein [Parabacteroides sp. PF5-6]|uniref:outer membrane beta-barrel family protein n=1 Tax=Parabacteroides sp. PF5-6 TaxID=1742403 RepID=UPI002404E5A8|nr:outer membrane beta-barrel family protein [Parabacteroides sp. PF5-6]MDF9828871.1 iron complex outermembrane receptor protein [Parabacteroides sp. PF5-6]
MKKSLFTSLLWAVPYFLFSQTPVDTLVQLQNIEIKGSRFSGLSGGEVKRLQVDGNLTSLPTTAADALRQIPSLSTDIEGGITFRGSNETSALLNRVPYGLLEEYSGDMLIQLPALFFNQMEVLAAPPIEWIPDGDAGLLNLTSTYSAQDSPLQLTLGGGWNERYNAGAVLNLHPGKFHLLARYNYRREFRERSFNKTTTTPTGTTAMNNNASARPDTHLADLELGYDLTAKDRLTLYGLYYLMDYYRYGGINNTRLNPQGEVMNRMLRHRHNNQQQEAYAAEMRWKHLFAQPGDWLEFTFNYNNFVYDEDNDYQNENPQTNAIVAQDNLFIRQQKDNYYWAVNYRKAMDHGFILKAGYLGRYKKENYTADAANLKEGSWVANPQKTDDYDFNRLTNLVYASVEKQWDNISGEVGLQAEQSRQKAADVENNYFQLYPRLRFTFQPDRMNRYTLAYQQRVIRPLGVELNPFIDRADATFVKQGNPDLMNEIIHSVELAYQLDGAGFRLSPALYYRYKDNRIMDVLQTIGEETVWQKQNVGSNSQFGAELSTAWTPVRFLTLSLSGHLFRDEIDGRTIGYNEKKSMTCWDVKGALNIHFTPDTELQIDGYHISDQLTPQGKIKSHATLNAGLSQYLMDRKLRLNLSVNNLFDTLKETTLIDTEALQMRQERNRDARVSWLTATYLF